MIERLRQQLAFIIEVDKLKNIYRQTYVADGHRKENDAEHSWHLALMAVLLGEYAEQEVDILKVMTMVLIHDIVEIDAGDTYAYDSQGNKTKKVREELAADRLFGILPADQQTSFCNLWEEFEENKTTEAQYARVLDHLQPMLLNDATEGKSWVEHGVDKTRAIARQEEIKEGAPILYETIMNIIGKYVESGKIKNE